MAEPGYDFTKQTAERILRAVRKIESLPPDRRRPKSVLSDDELHTIWFRNESASAGDVIPPYGVAAVIGCTEYQGFPLLRVEKPSSLVAPAYIFNLNSTVPTSGTAYGIVSGLVTVQYSTPPTTNYETYGPTSGSWALNTGSTVPLVKAIGVLNSSNVAGYTTGPTMLASVLTPTSAPDVKLAATSDNSGAYWSGLHNEFNASTVLTTGKDFLVESEVTGTTPNQKIRQYIDASDITGYTTGLVQFIAKDSSDNLYWTTITQGSSVVDTDEKLAATSENNGKYWAGLHTHFNASTVFNSTQDFKVESEVAGTTPDQTVSLYVDASDIYNYDSAYDQWLMHNSSGGGLAWRALNPTMLSSGTYNSTQDLTVKAELDNTADFRLFVDFSAITDYSTAAEQYLTNSSGRTHWTTGADVKLAVSSGNVGFHWSQLAGTRWFATTGNSDTGKDFIIDSEPVGSAPSQTLRLFVDASAIAGYTTGVQQFISKDTSDNLKWTTIAAAATGTDEKMAAGVGNTGLYWNTLHIDFNASTVFNSTQDFLVESELTGSIPDQQVRAYVDASGISNHDPNYDQFLMHNSSGGGLVWRALDAAIGSSGTYNSTQDFAIKWEFTGSVDLRPFVDLSVVSGYSTAKEQVLTNSSGATIWTTISAAAGVDEKLAATSENDGTYWSGLHSHFNASTVYNSTQDFKVESEVTGTTPNQDILLYIDASDISLHDAAYHQWLMHDDVNGGLVWRRSVPVVQSSGVFNSTADLLIETQLSDSDLRWFVDVSDISGYDTAKEQVLANSSGVTKWTTISAASTGVDEKLAATSENDGKYWSALHADYNGSTVYASGKDLLVESEVSGTTPNQTLKLYVDASDIPGYTATNLQFLYHDTSGNLGWIDATTCT